MRRGIIALVVVVAIACGGGDIVRPLNVEVEGFSGRADTLVLKVFPQSTGQTCAGVELGTVVGLSAPFETEWRRASMDERALSVPETIREDGVTLVAYSLCEGATPIQFACRQLTFEQIGEERLGVVFMTLSQRTEACP